MASKISALALSLVLGLAFVPCSFADDQAPANNSGDPQASNQGQKQGGGRRFGKRLRKRMAAMRHRKHKNQGQGAAQQGDGSGNAAPPQGN